MRVIAGLYRGRSLRSPPSLRVRPTSDRLRETLFNVLAPRVEGVRLLDLCAGSGAVGIEALSRGAAHATFVERSRKMCDLIKSNLALCEIDRDSFKVVTAEAADFVRRSARSNAEWEIIFFDPPYDTDYTEILAVIDASKVLSNSGVLVAEHYHKSDLSEEFGSLKRSRILKQGETSLSFYTRASATEHTKEQRRL